MSMFTRCAHCESTFRVTLAQLQASGGQVRCGVCLEVFDAFLALTARDPRVPAPEEPGPSGGDGVDASAASFVLEAPLPDPPPHMVEADGGTIPPPPIDDDPPNRFVPAPAADDDASAVMADAQESGDVERFLVGEAGLDDELEGGAGGFDAELFPTLPATDAPDPTGIEAVETGVSVVTDDVTDMAEPLEAGAFPDADGPVSLAFPEDLPVSIESDAIPDLDPPGDATAPAAEVSDVRAADGSSSPDAEDDGRALVDGVAPVAVQSGFAPSQPSRMSAGLVASAAVLALLLIAQGAYLLRAAIADAAPSMRPALETACGWVHCTIALPRLTDRLTIESSDLQALDPLHPNLVTVTATIRNRARVEQAFPLLELTLTDAREEVAARKVFGPNEYLSVARIGAGVAANAELGVRLRLDTADIVATGYRLYLFHP